MIKKYSFYGLINDYIIEIPIIQRDYAQGRDIPNVNYIRQKFVETLVAHILSDSPMHLGFIYGKIEGKDKLRQMQLHKDAVQKLLGTVTQYANQFNIQVASKIENDYISIENSLRLIPLDGQQRLTTLFLLHWYILIRQNNSIFKWVSNFKYNNRKSALAFFNELSNSENILRIRKELKERLNSDIAERIGRQTWFLSKWNYDATVSGSLTMLKQIHDEFLKYPDTNFNELNIENLDMSFDFLDLDELNQSDELYIKMNERGKQLTDFEHFKAWLQDFTVKRYLLTEQKVFLTKMWKKMDTTFLNHFWNKIDVDYTALDDFYFNYLKTLAITYHLAKFDSKDIPQFLKDLLQDIRNSESYDPEKLKYIPLSQFTYLIEEANKEPILFELFSFDALQFIDRSLEFLVKFDSQSKDIDTINQVVAEPFASKKIMNSFLKKSQFTLTLWDHVMYYAILKYFEKSTEANYLHLYDWLRVIRNLNYNSYVQNPENLYNALHSIDELFEKYFSDSSSLTTIILETTFELKFFLQSQLKEEKLKADLFKDLKWKEFIERLENHSYFYGQIGFIIAMSQTDDLSYDFQRFTDIGSVLETLFNGDTEDFLLQRALLSKGDYLIEVGSNHSFCKTDTDSLRSRNENWRRVFSDTIGYELLEKLLLDFLSRQSSTADYEDILADIIQTHGYTVDNWEYYFVESPYPLKWCGQREIRWNDNENVRLLPAKTVIGYHLELRTIFLVKYIYSELKTLKPFKEIDFLWAKGTAGRPGISLTGFKLNEKNYKLDIRYSFGKDQYEFCFYNVADIVGNRSAQNKIVEILPQYIYDEKFRHYFKQVKYDSITTEIKLLCNNLTSIVS